MAKYKDYHKVLEIDQDAGPEEIFDAGTRVEAKWGGAQYHMGFVRSSAGTGGEVTYHIKFDIDSHGNEQPETPWQDVKKTTRRVRGRRRQHEDTEEDDKEQQQQRLDQSTKAAVPVNHTVKTDRQSQTE